MMDILPNFAGLAGARLPPWWRIDGIDIRPILLGFEDVPPPRAVFRYFRGFELPAIRRGPWKLFLRTGELFNLDEDIGPRRIRRSSETSARWPPPWRPIWECRASGPAYGHWAMSLRRPWIPADPEP